MNTERKLARQVERFWTHVNKTETCWLWTAGKTGSGYGFVRWGVDNIGAHRASWLMSNGPIPDGLFLCHKCDRPPCVRPDHLFLGTPGDNSRDAAAKGRMAHGERVGTARLTEERVRALRSPINAGRKQRDIASEFGVSQTLVGMVLRREVWKHVL